MSTATVYFKAEDADHVLKTDPEVFQASWDGLKPWEIRFDDRGFEVGHTVVLKETRHSGEEMRNGAPLIYTGRMTLATIAYILRGQIYGLADGWCVMTLRPLSWSGWREVPA